MKIKLTQVLSLAFLIIILLASCNRAGVRYDPNNFNPTGFPISKEPITLTFAASTTVMTGDPSKMDLMLRLAEITNISVKWILLETAQIDIFYAGGNMPDLFYDTGTPQRLQTYGVEAGIFADWNDYLQYMPNLSRVFSDDPFMKKIVTELDGKVYALP